MQKECNMTNKSSKLYISDQTETSEQDANMGDVQVLIAGGKDKVVSYPKEKIGNQSKEYYE